MAESIRLRRELIQIAKEELNLEGDSITKFVSDELEKEHNRQLEKEKLDQEIRERERDREHELRLKQIEIDSISTRNIESENDGMAVPSNVNISFPMENFDERREEIDAYLMNFEGLAQEYQLPEEKWALKLSTHLKGSAYDTYSKLPVTRRNSYNILKDSLLRKFGKTAENFRLQFRSMKKDKHEAVSHFVDRLDTTLRKWLYMSDFEETFEGLISMILSEQLENSLSPEVKKFFVEQGACSLNSRIDLAERYLEANKFPINTNKTQPRGNNEGNRDGQKRTHHKEMHQNNKNPQMEKQSGKKPSKFCKYCKKSNHDISECYRLRNSKGTVSTVKTMEQVETTDPNIPSVTEIVKVNDKQVECLYDTGLSYDAIVRSDLVSPDKISTDTVEIQLADKSTPKQELQIGSIKIDSRYVKGEITAALMPNPAYDIILGCRYVFLGTPKEPEIVGAISKITKTVQEPDTPNDHFDNSLEIREEQKNDPSLKKCFEKLKHSQDPPQKGQYFMKKGLLYRQANGDHKQLVVPKNRRQQVLEMGHAIPLSGHMGTGATNQRISAHYFWPGINDEVKRFVKSCPQCQKNSSRTYTLPVTLGEMPVTGVPFERVAADIIGPLPISKRKNKFILCLVDTCTMWVEAVPLPKIDAKGIADSFLSIFTRLGFPSSILTDRGSQFTSKLMKEVFELIKIKHHLTSPFNPMANGQVERWNQTLISILRKIAADNPEEWDTYIPAALFAYREVPHTSTGMAPANLLFGRPLAGPLEALKKSWTNESIDNNVKNATHYLQELKEKLQTSWSIATENIKKARAKQAKLYNKHAKDRELEVGNKVLLLLPVGSNKLELSWQGPYTVTQKLSRTNYKIKINHKEKVYHVNLLKQYIERESDGKTNLFAMTIAEEVSETEDLANEYEKAKGETIKDIIISSELTSSQREELVNILDDFSGTFTDIPGKTDLVEVNMKLTDYTPIRTKPYPVPLAKEETIQSEIDEMLKAGIVSPSESAYSSPVILLRKPDGKHRLCVDLRRINAVLEFQAEPIPNVSEMFARMKNAAIFSKIDLSKGYYQIPVPKEYRQYLAFSTTKGHYEFNVLPFGISVAPSIFSRMMKKLLQPLNNSFIHHFMDDILIATKDWDSHIQACTQLFGRLKETGLTAKPSKCQFGFSELDFLGHNISAGILKPHTKNVEKMKLAPRPKTKKDVRSFLGMCGFYQKFIENFNMIAAPLTALTKKVEPDKVKWNADCETAFNTLKEKLTSGPILHLPNPEKTFILRTDASKQGLGATLFQSDDDDERILFPVAYASRKLSKAEENYATIEMECLSLIWGIQKFQMYLYGKKFKVQTDHQPLVFLSNSQHLNSRLMRWSLLLQPYSFHIEYIPGNQNHGSDFLSRHPCEEKQ